MHKTSITGSCLCGGIRVQAHSGHEVSVCHCTMCQRWSGGPLFSAHCGQDVQFSGLTPVAYRSSPWGERGFCPRCGSHLFYRMVENNDYFIPVGLFEQADFMLANQIFIDEKPAYYALSNDTPCLTAAEVFAQYSSKTD